LLSSARTGTYVLVYGGFGGRLPACYGKLREDSALPNTLSLWRKLASLPIGRSHRTDLVSSAGAA